MTDARVGIIDTRAVFNIWHPRVNLRRPTFNFHNMIQSFGAFKDALQLHPTSTRHPACAWNGTTEQQLSAPVVHSCVQPDAWWLQDVMAVL